MTTAQLQVFALPELVENILLQLPIRDLLVNAQLVNHDWNTAIKSRNLQQALFLLPASATSTSNPQFNPLLQEVFSPWFDPDQQKKHHTRGTEFKSLDWNSSDAKRAAITRKEASWRNMLPVQPPPTVFEINLFSMAMGGGNRKSGKTQMEDGVRMGILYDFAYKSIARPISGFWVEWNQFLPVNYDESISRGPGGNRVMLEERERDLMRRREEWVGSERVIMHVRWTIQCKRGMPDDLGKEFKSEAFEDLVIELE